jgi:hypothetical protein
MRGAVYDHMTVGGLLKFIKENNIQDDAVIFTQRVEDSYYKPGNGWHENSVFKEGMHYHQYKEQIDYAKAGKYDDRDQYPLMTDEHKQNIIKSEEFLEEFKEQYTQIWCPVTYPDDKNLYLDLHY